MAMEKRVKISMNVRMITLTIVTSMPVALIAMVRSPVPVTTVMKEMEQSVKISMNVLKIVLMIVTPMLVALIPMVGSPVSTRH